jgi:hypothetical protein
VCVHVGGLSKLISKVTDSVFLHVSTALLLRLGFSFSLLISYTVGRTASRGISPPQGRYLHTGQHKHRINGHIHPCLQWDSIPGSQCWTGEDSSSVRSRGHCDRHGCILSVSFSACSMLAVMTCVLIVCDRCRLRTEGTVLARREASECHSFSSCASTQNEGDSAS